MTTLAIAARFGFGERLMRTTDAIEAGLIDRVVKKAIELENEHDRNLARAIRNEIASAWNSGQKDK